MIEKSGTQPASAVWNKSKYVFLAWGEIFRSYLRSLLFVALSGQVVVVSAADITFDNSAGTGDWGTSTNWDIDAAPTAVDNAIIGGAFNVTGTLTDDIINLNYSSTGSSAISDGGFSITGQIANTASGQIDFTGNAAGLNNSSTGTTQVTGDVTGALISSGAGTVDVTGQLSTSGSTVLSTISDGAVTINQVDLSGGSDLQLTGGALTINNGNSTTATGSGTTVDVSNATLNALDGYSNLEDARLTVGGGADVNIAGTLRNRKQNGANNTTLVTVNGGTLDAGAYDAFRSQLRVNGGDVTLGSLNQSRAVTRQTGGEFNVTGNFSSNTFSNTTVSAGTMNVQGNVSNGTGSFTVEGTGVINVQGTISSNAAGFSSTTSNIRINNGGTLNGTQLNLNRGQLQQTGGTGNFSGGVSVSQSAAIVSGGELNVAGLFSLANVSRLTLSGAATVNANGGIVQNAGGFSHTVSNLEVQGSSVLNASSYNNRKGILTQTGGTFTVTGQVDNGSSQTGIMNISAGLFDIQGGLSNHVSGTINLNGTGEMTVAGGITNSSDFNVTSVDSTLTTDTLISNDLFNLDAGTVTVSDTATIASGQLDQDGGEFNVNGLLTTQGGGTINLDAGVLNANANMVNNGTTNLQGVGDLNLTGDLDNGGTFNVLGGLDALDIVNMTSSGLFNLDTNTVNVTGTATIENGGELDQDGGTMDVAGLLSTDSGGTINLDAGVLNANANMVNDGTTNLQGTGDFNLTGVLDNGGTFNVLGGASPVDIENITSSGLFNLDTNTVNVTGTATIENGGELDQDGGTMDVAGLLSTDAGGAINLDAGVLNANANMVNDGTTNLQAVGDLNLTGDLDNGGTFNVLGGLDALDIVNMTSSGLFNLDTNIVNVSGTATIENDGELDQDGGTMNVDGLLSTDSGGTIILDDGVLNANAGLTNEGITNWNGGNLNIAGIIVNEGTINSTVDDVLLVSNLVNQGSVKVNAGNLIFDFDDDFINDGEVFVADGASLSGESIINRSGSRITGGGVVNNHLNLQNGSFVVGDTNGLILEGDVTGTGTFRGQVTLNSNYTPVSGELHVIQHEHTALNGTTFLEVGNDGENDQLITNGDFTLGGELIVTQLDGTEIKEGNIYNLITTSDSGNLSGEFSSVMLPELAMSNWLINYNDSLYQIEVERTFVGGGAADGLDLNAQQESALNGIDDTTFTYFSEKPTLAALATAISEAVNARNQEETAFLSQGLAGNSLAHLPEFFDRQQQLLMDEVYHRHCPQWRTNSTLNECHANDNQPSVASSSTKSNSTKQGYENDNKNSYATAGVAQISVAGQDSGALGYTGDIQNVTMGHEGEFSDANRVGMTLSYSQLSGKSENGFSKTKAHTVGLVFHHEYNFEQGWDINSIIGASRVIIDQATRRVYPSIEATGDTKGSELFGFVEGGYEWQTDGGSFIRPFARLSYTSSNLDGYNESGEGSLIYDRTDYRVSRGHLGLEYATQWNFDNGDNLITNVSMHWDRALSVRGGKVRSEFVGGGGQFETFLVESPDWQVTARLNLDYRIHEQFRIYSNISTVLEEASSDQYGLSLGIEYRF